MVKENRFHGGKLHQSRRQAARRKYTNGEFDSPPYLGEKKKKRTTPSNKEACGSRLNLT